MAISIARRIRNFVKQLAAGEINTKMLRYHLVEKLLGRWRREGSDEFNWSRYTLHYQGELALGSRTRSLIIGPGDYAFSDGRLAHVSSSLPLHPYIHVIFETILQLQPASVLEVGCGGGDHLHNLRVLQPALELRGADLSPQQIEFLRERHPELAAAVGICDITQPVDHLAPADLVYTNAVLMHIGVKEGRWERALKNLFSLARRHVLLAEDWNKHDYVALLKNLAPGKDIPWPTLHLYSRPSPASGLRRLLVASLHPLPYDPVASASDLLRP